MSILSHAPEWHDLDVPTPLDVLDAAIPAEGFPGTAEDVVALLDGPGPVEDHPPRFVIRPERGGWSVVDRSQDGPDGRALVVGWHWSRRDALDQAEDLCNEDWPDLGQWWLSAPPSEHLDRPIRLAPRPAAPALRRIESDAYPPF